MTRKSSKWPQLTELWFYEVALVPTTISLTPDGADPVKQGEPIKVDGDNTDAMTQLYGKLLGEALQSCHGLDPDVGRTMVRALSRKFKPVPRKLDYEKRRHGTETLLHQIDEIRARVWSKINPSTGKLWTDDEVRAEVRALLTEAELSETTARQRRKRLNRPIKLK